MRRMQRRRPSFIGWTAISGFAICGGILFALAALAIGRWTSAAAALGGLATGAAAGGFFAGRASPHQSYLEPALAGVLVVAAVMASAYLTPLGKLLLATDGVDPWRRAALLAGTAMVAGLAGAVVGELSGDSTRPGALRWAGLSLWLTAGALLLVGLTATIALVNETVQQRIAAPWWGAAGEPSFLDEERLVLALAATLGASSLLGGFLTQMAAPRRHLLAASVGPPLLVGVLVAASAAFSGATAAGLRPALMTAAVAALIAWLGAASGWLVRVLRGTL